MLTTLRVLFTLLFLIAVSASLAQSPQATIAGSVRDSQDAIVSGAEVAAVNSSTGVRTATRTNESGHYALNFLPIGDYELVVEQAGFRRYVRREIKVTTGQSLELNVTLEFGAVTESVNVSARASILQTMNSDVSTLVESKTIEDMPLGDRRSMNMINMVGAAVFVSLSARAFVEAVSIGANHGSDSTASIAGQLWGAMHGLGGIPHDSITALDVLPPLLHVARPFLAVGFR